MGGVGESTEAEHTRSRAKLSGSGDIAADVYGSGHGGYVGGMYS
jgi:hypothetical protein